MTTELPENPESREESYLASIAGQDVVLPDEPLSRKEQYLAYIAENGGGGGSSYTAGTGIDITGNTISVDEEVIPTLTELNKRVVRGTGAPTTATEGVVGGLYEDSTNGKLYICTAITAGVDPNPDTYTWEEVGGSNAPTVVQTTGLSTTDVMSQKATTEMIYSRPDAYSKKRINIGNLSFTNGDYGVAIGSGISSSLPGAQTSDRGVAVGYVSSSSIESVAIGSGAKAGAYNSSSTHSVALGSDSTASSNGSVALGARSATTRVGEVNIGTSYTQYGYNSTNYRVLGGVHDGQLANDAVTVEQVNGVIDAINTALSTSISHIGATS